MITGLNHLTINVTDLEKAKQFYETVFELVQTGSVNMGDHTLTYYDLGRGVRLELIDYEHKDQPAAVKETLPGTYRHMCVEVEKTEDLHEIVRRCRTLGCGVRQEPAFVEKLGCTNILLTDPSGVEIEVFCYPEGKRS